MLVEVRRRLQDDGGNGRDRQRHGARSRHPGHARSVDAPLATLHKVLCPREEGGLLSRKGVVDFTVVPGRRARRIRRRRNAPSAAARADERPAPGRRTLLHVLPSVPSRPACEVPLSAAAAVLFGQSHMRPLPIPSAEVAARAKRDLAVGETLDAIGEYCYRGFALSRADALARDALPLGLAQGATVRLPIARAIT